MAANKYGTREVYGGRHRVVKLFGNEDFAEKGDYATQAQAQGRAAQLEKRAARSEAVTLAKRRAKNRCECKGKCGQHFDARKPCIWGEGDDIVAVDRQVRPGRGADRRRQGKPGTEQHQAPVPALQAALRH